MELLVPLVIAAAMLLTGLVLACLRGEIRTLILLIVPAALGGTVQGALGLIRGHMDSWTIIATLCAMVWGTIIAAGMLRSSYTVAFLMAPAAFGLALYLGYTQMMR